MTRSTRAPLTLDTRPDAPSRAVRWADSAGVFGAVFAALCCMGAPVIVGVLGAIGLSWMRQDIILWPLMFLSLVIALWGLLRDWRRHGAPGPIVLGLAGAVALVTGVVFAHGPPARLWIYSGAMALIIATGWNVAARRSPVRRTLSA